MIKLEKETKEKEKMVGNKWKLEKDEADMVEAQKVQKQEELEHKKKRRIIESPTQSSLPKSPDYTSEKKNSIDNNELSPSRRKNLQGVRLMKRKTSNHPLNHHYPTHLFYPFYSKEDHILSFFINRLV